MGTPTFTSIVTDIMGVQRFCSGSKLLVGNLVLTLRVQWNQSMWRKVVGMEMHLTTMKMRLVLAGCSMVRL